jgi:hypothetical protein
LTRFVFTISGAFENGLLRRLLVFDGGEGPKLAGSQV